MQRIASKQRTLYTAKQAAQAAQEDHAEKLNEFKRVSGVLESLMNEINTLRCRTPRPHWGSANDYLPSGSEIRPSEMHSTDIVEALYLSLFIIYLFSIFSYFSLIFSSFSTDFPSILHQFCRFFDQIPSKSIIFHHITSIFHHFQSIFHQIASIFHQIPSIFINFHRFSSFFKQKSCFFDR